MQNKELAIVLTLRVLPDDNAAETFAQTPVGEWNEEDKWFYNDELVAQTGTIKRHYEEFYKMNSDADVCFLVSLDLIDSNKAPSDISVLKNGHVIMQDFTPPPQILDRDVLTQENGWNNYKFTLEFKANNFVNKIEAKYWDISGDQTIDNAKSYFAEIDGSTGEGAITITDLFPETKYGVVFYLWSDAGRGQRSEVEYEFTTLPTSKPADLRVNAIVFYQLLRTKLDNITMVS